MVHATFLGQAVEDESAALRNASHNFKANAKALAVKDHRLVYEFAQQLQEQNKGKWMEVDRLGGFCQLVKREVLTRFGSLEQWSDLSIFDTDV